jgi:hypothetical protein
MGRDSFLKDSGRQDESRSEHLVVGCVLLAHGHGPRRRNQQRLARSHNRIHPTRRPFGRRAFVEYDLAAGWLVQSFAQTVSVDEAWYLICPKAVASRHEVQAFRRWIAEKARATAHWEEHTRPKERRSQLPNAHANRAARGGRDCYTAYYTNLCSTCRETRAGACRAVMGVVSHHPPQPTGDLVPPVLDQCQSDRIEHGHVSRSPAAML